MQHHSEHPYERLTPDCVIDAVEAAGYPCDARLLALNSYENRVYQVGMEEGPPLVAKFYRPGRWSDEQILEEHAFSLELQAADISVVAPLQSASGESLHQHQGFRFALFPRRGGHPPELDNLDNMLVLGRTIGRMHRVGAAAAFRTRPYLTIDSHFVSSRDYLLAEGFIPRELIAAYESLTDDLLTRLRAALANLEESDCIRVHGDCHAGNILWRDETAHFVDLDDCCMAPAIQDLWMCLNGDRQERQLQLAELIEGYSDFADFAPRELRWVEALRTLRIVNYAAWLARRWGDPAFPKAFPWFNSERFWGDHILQLREQMFALEEEPLQLL